MATIPLNCLNCGETNPKNEAVCLKCGSPLYLNERYHIVEALAKGGMSDVFKAEDVACFNRTAAVKEFTPKDKSPNALRNVEEDCKREAELLAKLNHPGIPKIYDCFARDNNWYLVRSFIEGETLAHLLRARRDSRLTMEQILSIGMHICSVLQYLHSLPHPIIFCDLTPTNIVIPSNIMLKNDMHVYLIDFGSACYRDQSSSINIAGTPGYTAPEIAYRRASLRSDIYSLGAILFQLVTGKKPTERTTHSERFHSGNRIVHQGPNELWDLIKQMMEEESDNRPDSIADVQKELQKIANQPAAVPLEREDASSDAALARRSFLLGGIAIGIPAGIAGIILGAKEVGPLLGLGSPAPRGVLFPLTVGGKLSNEDALLTEMYVLLLHNAGYEVHDKSKLGTNDYVFNALLDGTIDLYPEFLLTGLARLEIPTTHDQQKDFQGVQQGFMNRYQITWLDQAVKLSDNYCVAMAKTKAAQLGIKSLSDLMQYIKQNNIKFALAVAPDGKTGALPSLKAVYGLTFSSTIDLSEEDTFAAVLQDQAQLNICYATDPLIAKDNFVRLIDDKRAFPIDPPSPIIRTEVLDRSPGIATVLNSLAPNLSSDVSTMLQAQMLQGRSASDVAQDWLKSQGLL